MNNILVREATVNDLDQLALLFDSYRIFYRKPSDPEGARAFLQARLERQESVIFVVLTGAGTLSGFVQLYPLFSSTRMQRLWLLNDLFVDPAVRGRGLSKALIQRAQQHCLDTGGCALTLETEQSNTIGNQLYPAMGFCKDSTHNFYEWDASGTR